MLFKVNVAQFFSCSVVTGWRANRSRYFLMTGRVMHVACAMVLMLIELVQSQLNYLPVLFHVLLFCGMGSPQMENVTVRRQVCTGIAGSFSPEFCFSIHEFRPMLATDSGHKCQVSTGIGVLQVVTFRRISGRFGLEYASITFFYVNSKFHIGSRSPYITVN